MVTCADRQGHIALATKRTKRKTEAIIFHKGTRRHRMFTNNDFDSKYKAIGVSATSTAETWLKSQLPISEKARRELSALSNTATNVALTWEDLKMGKKKTEVAEGEVKQRSRGPRGMDKTATINILVEANPKKPSSASYARFDLYQDGMSVAEALEAGITTADIKYDIAKGFISVG